VNEERTGKCLRQVEHIRGHLWHRYSITVNQVMVATVQVSKWRLQINQWGSCYSIFSFICMFYRSFFVFFLLAIVLSVLLRYTDSDCPFGIFKLFLNMDSGRVGSSCSSSDIRRVNLVTNPIISREWGKNREVLTTSGTYPWSFVTQIFHNGQPSRGGDCKIFEVMTSTLSKGTHMEYIYLRWYDIPEIVVPIRISLIEGCY
jgi:hypothetical protein